MKRNAFTCIWVNFGLSLYPRTSYASEVFRGFPLPSQANFTPDSSLLLRAPFFTFLHVQLSSRVIQRKVTSAYDRASLINLRTNLLPPI
jgi:hypothetical protein